MNWQYEFVNLKNLRVGVYAYKIKNVSAAGALFKFISVIILNNLKIRNLNIYLIIYLRKPTLMKYYTHQTRHLMRCVVKKTCFVDVAHQRTRTGVVIYLVVTTYVIYLIISYISYTWLRKNINQPDLGVHFYLNLIIKF